MKKITPAELPTIDSVGSVVVMVTSPGCAPCKRMRPIIGSLADELEIDAMVLCVGEHRDTAIGLGVRSAPTFFLYKDGKQIDSLVGYQEPDMVRKWLNQ